MPMTPRGMMACDPQVDVRDPYSGLPGSVPGVDAPNTSPRHNLTRSWDVLEANRRAARAARATVRGLAEAAEGDRVEIEEYVA